jgi:hypothetical protein
MSSSSLLSKCTMSSTSSASSVTSETWDDWTEPPAPVQALFSAQIFDTPELALQHDKTIHGVDVALLASTLGTLIPPRKSRNQELIRRWGRLLRKNPSHQLHPSDRTSPSPPYCLFTNGEDIETCTGELEAIG